MVINQYLRCPHRSYPGTAGRKAWGKRRFSVPRGLPIETRQRARPLPQGGHPVALAVAVEGQVAQGEGHVAPVGDDVRLRQKIAPLEENAAGAAQP